jgi:DNA-binding NtrC family response regulator
MRTAQAVEALAPTAVLTSSELLAALPSMSSDLIIVDQAQDGPTAGDVLAATGSARPWAIRILLDVGAAPSPARDLPGVVVCPTPIEPRALQSLCTLGLRCAKAARQAHAAAREASPDDLPKLDAYEGILTRSPAMKRVVSRLQQTMAGDGPICIQGEPGTGKALVARAIHRRSPRVQAPFLIVRLGALADQAHEAELFGRLGTPARPGLLAAAEGGTLFLDQLESANASLQSALLRALDNGTFTGGSLRAQSRPGIRLLAGTTRDLQHLVRQGIFRRDLYDRLHALRVDLPSLRERPEDIFALAQLFLARACREMGRIPPGISREARVALERHPWHGNVRELANAMERAALSCRAGLVIAVHLHLGAEPPPALAAVPPGSSAIVIPPMGASLQHLEREIFLRTLALAGGNQSRAASILGLRESTFRFRLRKLGIASRRAPHRDSRPAASPQLVASA